MYVTRLQISDFRAFRTASIELLYPGRRRDDVYGDVRDWPPRLANVTVFLGNNGSGKSTILDGLALALISPLAASSGFRPQSLIRRSNRGRPKEASITADVILHPQDRHGDLQREKFEAVVERRGDIEFLHAKQNLMDDRYFDEDNGAFFFVGYGATRRAEALSATDMAVRRRARAVRYERVASLFEDHFALTPLSSWLPAWQTENPGRYKQVVGLLNKLMPPSVKFTSEMEAGEYLFKHRNIAVPYGSLSDGFRAYIGWIGDLLYHLCMGAPSGHKLVESRGVVMVDEIDLHIHPAWQRTVIPTLARTLKNVQFIFTTHSPLVVSTLERGNIWNVEVGAGGIPGITRPTEETFGLSADQILRSEVFGLDSTRDPEFAEKLHTLSKAAERGESGAALAYLRGASAGGGEALPEPGEAPVWLKKFSSAFKGES